MDRDGTKAGYDLALTRAVADAVAVPVIASGGVGNARAPGRGRAPRATPAVLAASIFHFGTHTIAEAKAAMAAAGIPVRPLMPDTARPASSPPSRPAPAPTPPPPTPPRCWPTGPAKCAKKFGEEAVETVVAAAQGDRAALTREAPTCSTTCR